MLRRWRRRRPGTAAPRKAYLPAAMAIAPSHLLESTLAGQASYGCTAAEMSDKPIVVHHVISRIIERLLWPILWHSSRMRCPRRRTLTSWLSPRLSLPRDDHETRVRFASYGKLFCLGSTQQPLLAARSWLWLQQYCRSASLTT